MTPADALPALTVRLASPRGFCAGVDRAIQIVERAIEKYGAPVYVRHEIVHNRHVVERLRALGAVFVKDLDEAPVDRPVVFSAHGVPKSVPAAARSRQMFFLDATCPLVSKVHVEAERHFAAGRQVLLIGHTGHPEVIGTLGQLPAGAILLVETPADVASTVVRDPAALAYCTQTTLSVDEAAEMIAAVKARFPAVVGPHKEDVCYATTNRQEAVSQLAAGCDLVLVVGSANSSNSKRLVEKALSSGARAAYLVEDASAIEARWLDGVRTLGLTAGASAPEDLVTGVLDCLRRRSAVTVEEIAPVRESVVFKLPRVLNEPVAA